MSIMKGDTEMYVTNITKAPAGFYVLIQKKKDTKEVWLRNEIGLTYTVENGEFKIIDGWMIGADEISLDENDNDILEHFFPGLILQLMEETKDVAA